MAADAPLIRLELAEQQNENGALKHIWGSTQITIPAEPELKPVEDGLETYELLFLGTPVWAGGVSPPMRSFLESREFFRDRFALFATYSGRTGKVFHEFRRLLAGSEILGELGVREPREQSPEDLNKRAEAWVKEVEKQLS